MLGEYRNAIDHDFEDAVIALLEFSLDSKFFGNYGRQTGGPGQIVSLTAVDDGDLHGAIPIYP